MPSERRDLQDEDLLDEPLAAEEEPADEVEEELLSIICRRKAIRSR